MGVMHLLFCCHGQSWNHWRYPSNILGSSSCIGIGVILKQAWRQGTHETSTSKFCQILRWIVWKWPSCFIYPWNRVVSGQCYVISDGSRCRKQGYFPHNITQNLDFATSTLPSLCLLPFPSFYLLAVLFFQPFHFLSSFSLSFPPLSSPLAQCAVLWNEPRTAAALFLTFGRMRNDDTRNSSVDEDILGQSIFQQVVWLEKLTSIIFLSGRHVAEAHDFATWDL